MADDAIKRGGTGQGGGGALSLESGTGMCHGHDPLFQASRRSLAYQFTVNMYEPPCSIYKIFAFWVKILSSLDPNFSKFVPNTSFFQENLLSTPYFWKPVWHTVTHPPKKKEKKLSAPGGGGYRSYGISGLYL